MNVIDKGPSFDVVFKEAINLLFICVSRNGLFEFSEDALGEVK